MRAAIAMATFNGERYLREQLDSILGQTYRDLVCYIHDDGSTDGTPAILEEYRQRDPERIQILTYPPGGSAKMNFWSLLHRIREPYLFFSDQDDVWLPGKVEQMMACMAEAEQKFGAEVPTAVFCDMKVVGEDLAVISDSFERYSGFDPARTELNELIVQNVAAGCSMLVNRPLIERALACRNYGDVRMHDWWLMLNAAIYGKIIYINEPLVLYRQHGDNTLGAVEEKTPAAFFRSLKNLLSGRQIPETRERIANHQRQAAQLWYLDDVPEQFQDMLYFLAHAKAFGKLQRIRNYLKYRLLRNNRRNWWTLLWL